MSKTPWAAISLFRGGGLSDLGYEMAGFRLVVQLESDPRLSLLATPARSRRSGRYITVWLLPDDLPRDTAPTTEPAATAKLRTGKVSGRTVRCFVATAF